MIGSHDIIYDITDHEIIYDITDLKYKALFSKKFYSLLLNSRLLSAGVISVQYISLGAKDFAISVQYISLGSKDFAIFVQ